MKIVHPTVKPLAIILFCVLSSFLASAQTFSQSQTLAANHPTAVKLADVNGDGKLDLIFAGNQTMSVRLGIGNGQFQTTGSDFLTYGGAEIETPDLNKDGHVDIVTTGDVDTIDSYTGNGDGTFSNFAEAAGPACDHSDATNSISTVDVNKDGKIDVVASTGCMAVLFLGIGDGSFGGGLLIANEGSYLHDLEAGDINHDGNVDIAFLVNDSTGLSTLYVAYGDGTGHFGTRRSIASGYFTHLKVKDLNGDGRADIMGVASGCADGACTARPFVFYSNSGGTFTEQLGSPWSGYTQSNITYADFNLDGVLDLATTGETFQQSPDRDDAVFIYPRSSTGAIVDPTFVSLGTNYSVQPGDLAAGDLNGDKKPDLVVSGYNTNQIIVLLNTNPTPQTCSAPSSLYTVHICSPVSGSTVTSPVQISATGKSDSTINANRIYVNGTSKYSGTGANVQTQLALSAGSQHITVKYWDAAGHVFSSSVDVTVSGSGSSCAAPSSAGINLCSPVNGTTVGSPVSVTAAAKAAVKISAMKVYIDGTSKYSTTASSVSQSFTLSAGSHRITVKAWDTSGAVYAKSVTITVK